jgi:YVTN family beta-propeller protein
MKLEQKKGQRNMRHLLSAAAKRGLALRYRGACPRLVAAPGPALKFLQFHLAPPLVALLIALAPQGALCDDAPGSSSHATRRVRQPVALTCADGGKTVFVANRRSGSISIIDAATRGVVAEYDVGRSLADLAFSNDGHYLMAVDPVANELLLLDYRDRSIQVVDRVKVSPYPVRLLISRDHSLCVVASLWSRRLTFVGLASLPPAPGHPELAVAAILDLPFCPRELAALEGDHKLIVADAFGGRFAIIDPQHRAIDSVRSLPAHNIRGLAVAPDGKTLVIAHQVLNRLAQSSLDDVHWGSLIRNHLRVVHTDIVLRPRTDAALLDGSRLFDLGDVGYAAGDPSALTFDARGDLIIALAGVDEVAITASPDQSPRRITVGRRPTALAPSPDGSFLYVADTLDDTVSVVEISSGARPATIALGPRPDLTAADRGERLFYSAKLSHDGWMSCHTCHSDGHTNNLSSDTLGDGSYGAPKRVPSLLGVSATSPWTWTGSIARLEDQVRKSIATTMHGPKPADSQVADLTAFLASLAPPSSSETGETPADATGIARGREVFQARKCATCHVPPEYTSPERYDVGLKDEVGNHEFNPPSLRGVGLRDTLLHDGRARSLDEVFQKEQHPRGLTLSAAEIRDLVAFLKTL